MIYMGFDDQRGGLTVAQGDAMPAFGCEPAALETLGYDDDFVAVAGREIQIFLDAFLGEAADDAG